MTPIDPTWCEMAVALALPPLDADRLDLMSDVHPVEQRALRESEETFGAVWPAMRLLRRDHLDRMGGLRLWRAYFPDLLEIAERVREVDLHRERDSFARTLWERTLASATVLRIAYAVRPPDLTPNVLRVARQSSDALNTRVRAWAESLGHTTNGAGAAFVSQRFPLRSAPGELIDARSGAAARLRSDLAFATSEEGLLFGYLDARREAIECMLSPRQFEYVTARMFEADGWCVTLTRASKDGGNDVVARREENGHEVVSYVQAKRFAKARPVGVAKVREFAFVLARDEIQRGYIVTTSTVSDDAKREFATSGARRVATVEFIEGDAVRDRVRALANKMPGVFDLHPE